MKKMLYHSIKVFLIYTLLVLVSGFIINEFTILNPLRIKWSSLILEVITLSLLYAFITTLLVRPIASHILTVTLYLGFMLANIQKINQLQVPIFPNDVYQLSELVNAWDSFVVYLPYLILFFFFLLIFIYLQRKFTPNKSWQNARKYLWPTWLCLFLLLSLQADALRWTLKKTKLAVKNAHPWSSSEKNGFAYSFFYRMIITNKPDVPEGYSFERIQQIVLENSPIEEIKSSAETDVIIFFIEAFIDPLDMGIKTTFDPIPNFRRLRNKHPHGYAISPVIGGRSANAEFELLTGLSMRSFAPGTIPYTDFINHPISSLAREFSLNGYYSKALHVADLGFFNYTQVYPLLGFDDQATLWKKPGVEMDLAKRYPSENALVKEIISITETSSKPSFIFSFPNSTHGFWNYDAYSNSELDVIGDFIEDGKAQLKTYINALHYADKAIGKLTEYYQKQPNKTLILFVGDHQPSLPELRQEILIKEFYNKDEARDLFNNRKQMKQSFAKLNAQYPIESRLLQHRVPYVLWSNYELQNHQSLEAKELSMNLLHNLIFKYSDAQLFSPLYQLTGKIAEHIGVFSMVIKQPDGSYGLSADSEQQSLVNDYELLQYDILHGEGHYFNLTQTH